MTLNTTNFQFALKEMYPDDVMRDLTYQDNPFLSMVTKEESPSVVGGKYIHCPVVYGNPQGRSASLSTAIANKGNTSGVAFLLTLASDYSVASIDRKTILSSRSDAQAVAEAVETETDGAFNTCSRSLAKALYRDGNGNLGQVATGGLSSADPMVITLKNINDITNFEVGMVIEADDNASGASLKTTPATITIAGIDEDAGTITTDYDNGGGTTNWAADDYLFQDGDGGNMLSGLEAWNPASAPSQTTFFNVDRTAHVSRLGGLRLDGTGMPVEQALLKGAARTARAGGRPNAAFINDVQYYELITSLGSKVQYVKQGATANVFFDGVVIHGPRGTIEVYPDYNCPSAVARVLQMDTWTLYSLDKAPHIFDLDNDQKLLRETTADAYELRIGYYAQLGCKAPGWNCRVSLDAATF